MGADNGGTNGDDALTTSKADVYAALCFSKLLRCIEDYEASRVAADES